MKQRLSDAGVARLKGEKGRGREEKKKKRKKEGQLRDIKSMLLLLRIFWFIELGSSVGPDFPLVNFSTSTLSAQLPPLLISPDILVQSCIIPDLSIYHRFKPPARMPSASSFPKPASRSTRHTVIRSTTAAPENLFFLYATW